VPSENFSKHQQRSIKKSFEEKDNRLERKERQKERQLQKAQSRPRPAEEPDDFLFDEDDLQDLPRPRSVRTRSAVQPRDHSGYPVATVIEVYGRQVVVLHEGRVLRARLDPSIGKGESELRSPIAVGDRVRLEVIPTGESRIPGILPRRTILTRGAGDMSRRDGISETHVLAANIDQVVIVCSAAEPPFRPRLIDRFLVAASRDGLPVVLCLNKVDMGMDQEVESYLRGYSALGVSVLRVSAVSGQGISALRQALEGRTSLLTGHSGVGKSSLLNALEPGLALRVGQVTQSTAGQGKGRHTTSSARLVPLSGPDTLVVDSPGIRAFGIGGISPKDLAAHFPDIALLAPECSFHDCLHNGEDGCAVAVEAERDPFLQARWESYKGLVAEVG
jgi:ribosome biogenesis GTPase